jgi:hypothetical protein
MMRKVDVVNGDRRTVARAASLRISAESPTFSGLLLVVCLFIGTTVEKSWEHFIQALLSRLSCLSSILRSLRYRRRLPLPHIVPLVAYCPTCPFNHGEATGKPYI